MSSTASVPNSFANAVTATGAQLDANYTTIVAYLNDPTNRNNYAADGAATNTVVLTFSPPVVGGYTAGLDLCWKWGVTNTGPVVASANGLGNISVVNPDGSALQAGQGKAGSIGRAVYDGTRAIYIGASAQKQQESKAWCVFNGFTTGTITPDAQYNVTNVVRTGTGSYSINFSTALGSAKFAFSGGAQSAASIYRDAANANTTAAAHIIVGLSTTAAPVDVTEVTFICFGL